MAKTLQVSGYLLFNTSSLDSSGSVDIEHTTYGYGTYTSSSFSASVEFTDLHPHIIITEVVDQRPCVNFGDVEWTFNDLTDVTGSWNYFSQSLQGIKSTVEEILRSETFAEKITELALLNEKNTV